MSENKQPRKYDAVIGTQPQSPMYGAVMGGIDGLKNRFKSVEDVSEKAKILEEALQYEEEGEKYLLEILEKEKEREILLQAYTLLNNQNKVTIEEIRIFRENKEYFVVQKKLKLLKILYTISDKNPWIELPLSEEDGAIKYYLQSYISLEEARVEGQKRLAEAQKSLAEAQKRAAEAQKSLAETRTKISARRELHKVQQRFNSTEDANLKAEILPEALQYQEEGVNFILKVAETTNEKEILAVAYDLLKDKQESKIQNVLLSLKTKHPWLLP
ncbi:hypothetical protein ACN4EE_04405 [Geminocystis sp. CENA526]|uniref:hypothetical protein n=1 Tax=Geminocystis sp. CENA526 TaxID=1355871 RepID=UPI003D6ED689